MELTSLQKETIQSDTIPSQSELEAKLNLITKRSRQVLIGFLILISCIFIVGNLPVLLAPVVTWSTVRDVADIKLTNHGIVDCRHNQTCVTTTWSEIGAPNCPVLGFPFVLGGIIMIGFILSGVMSYALWVVEKPVGHWGPIAKILWVMAMVSLITTSAVFDHCLAQASHAVGERFWWGESPVFEGVTMDFVFLGGTILMWSMISRQLARDREDTALNAGFLSNHQIRSILRKQCLIETVFMFLIWACIVGMTVMISIFTWSDPQDHDIAKLNLIRVDLTKIQDCRYNSTCVRYEWDAPCSNLLPLVITAGVCLCLAALLIYLRDSIIGYREEMVKRGQMAHSAMIGLPSYLMWMKKIAIGLLVPVFFFYLIPLVMWSYRCQLEAEVRLGIPLKLGLSWLMALIMIVCGSLSGIGFGICLYRLQTRALLPPRA